MISPDFTFIIMIYSFEKLIIFLSKSEEVYKAVLGIMIFTMMDYIGIGRGNLSD